MRLYEFADAEAQLALLRTIIDNTWTAIAQQAEQQKRVDAERKAQAKLKPRSKKSRKCASIRIPTPKPPPPKQPQAPLAKQPPSPLNKPNPNALNAVKPLPPTNPQLKPLTTSTSATPKLSPIPYTKHIAKTSINQQSDVKDRYFGKNIGTLEKDDDGDDRHSKNGLAALKK
ncbi:hypothetical protein [Shewanella sp.]|uniref:hypothetical protein n=1 Tax=Shewanella sp. TaxID=50422 RepID=UPI004047AB41